MNKLESSEDYLERILMLTEKNGSVRSIDIANDMGFSKPSVSVAMKKLKAKGYIIVNDNGTIVLTPEGKQIAEYVYDKHRFLTNILISIGVNPVLAEEDACKIEHELSDETFAKLREKFKDGKIYNH